MRYDLLTSTAQVCWGSWDSIDTNEAETNMIKTNNETETNNDAETNVAVTNVAETDPSQHRQNKTTRVNNKPLLFGHDPKYPSIECKVLQVK